MVTELIASPAASATAGYRTYGEGSRRLLEGDRTSRSTPAPPPANVSSTCSLSSQLETSLHHERRLEGIAKAKVAGVYKGRRAPR
jgi:hypothetical protein